MFSKTGNRRGGLFSSPEGIVKCENCFVKIQQEDAVSAFKTQPLTNHRVPIYLCPNCAKLVLPSRPE